MGADVLVHLEHVNFGLLEHSLHFRITKNLALVGRVLEVIGFDVLP